MHLVKTDSQSLRIFTFLHEISADKDSGKLRLMTTKFFLKRVMTQSLTLGSDVF